MTVIAEVRNRVDQASYLKVPTEDSSQYEFMGTGFKELNESPSAQTSSKKYINNRSATKSITSYDWSTAFSLDQVRSEKIIDFICRIGEEQLTGADAESEYIIVSLDKKGSKANEFYARKISVAIEVSSFEDNDGEMGASGNLLGKGDIEIGIFNTTTKEFTANQEAASLARKNKALIEKA